MKKKSFWKGFLIGNLIFIGTVTFFYFKFVVNNDVQNSHLLVEDLNGVQVNLNKDFGKPMVINYWATWCVPCIKEFPYFEKIKQEMGENVDFFMISDEPIEVIKKYAKSNPFNFNYLRAFNNLSEYGIFSRPTTYFYDKNGKLIIKHTSSLDENTLIELIKKIR